MERERLRQIALEFKQSGAFSSIASQSQSFQAAFQQQNQQTIPLLTTFPTFTSFPMMNANNVAPIVEPVIQLQAQPPKEKSQAFLEAIAASQRIVASKNFNEMFSCSNSNDSTSNGPTYNSGSNSSKYTHLRVYSSRMMWSKGQIIGLSKWNDNKFKHDMKNVSKIEQSIDICFIVS